MEKDKVFESNPNLEVYYKTSDGSAFYNENLAQLHAKTLSDKTVEPVYKSVLAKVGVVLENIKQDKIQDAVATDLMSEMQTEAEKLAQKEADDLAKKEAQEIADKEAEESVKQEAPVKEKKVTQPKEK